MPAKHGHYDHATPSATCAACASTVLYGLARLLAVTLFISHPGDKMRAPYLPCCAWWPRCSAWFVVPMLAGMALRSRNPLLCAAVEAPFAMAAAALVVAVFIRLGYLQIASFEAAGLRMVGAVVSLNLIGWVMAGAIGVGFRLSRSEFIAIKHGALDPAGRDRGIRRGIDRRQIPISPLPLIINSAVGFLLSVVMNGTTALLAGPPLGGSPGMNSTKLDLNGYVRQRIFCRSKEDLCTEALGASIYDSMVGKWRRAACGTFT